MAICHIKMYLISLLTKLLHFLPAEFSHLVAMKGLKISNYLGLLKLLQSKIKSKPDTTTKDMTRLVGKVGLAAGLDKNGDFINSLGALGFGFIEVGTITPKSQPGNPKPRVFRFKDQEAIVNSLGFNNKGVDYLVKRVKDKRLIICK